MSLVVIVVVSITMIQSCSTSSRAHGPNPGAGIISILDTDVEGTTNLKEEQNPQSILEWRSIFHCQDTHLRCLNVYLSQQASQHLDTIIRLYIQTDGTVEYGIPKKVD